MTTNNRALVLFQPEEFASLMLDTREIHSLRIESLVASWKQPFQKV